MGMNWNRRRVAAWIACFAVLLASLAPSISYALAAASQAGSSHQEEICSGTGHRVMDSATDLAMESGGDPHAGHDLQNRFEAVKANDNPHSGHSPGNGMHFEHCPFCFTHAGSFALPPSETLAVLATAVCTARMPLRFYQCATPIFVWSAAQPRAPPSPS